jgi:hypothetical protein
MNDGDSDKMHSVVDSDGNVVAQLDDDMYQKLKDTAFDFYQTKSNPYDPKPYIYSTSGSYWGPFPPFTEKISTEPQVDKYEFNKTDVDLHVMNFSIDDPDDESTKSVAKLLHAIGDWVAETECNVWDLNLRTLEDSVDCNVYYTEKK